ncbi:AT-rich interactive domain-containing protein 5B [Electrophorus electricus]|uniref:AT-rich interactive domain-containing protein 5B n=1 Tax=Electrophorus electricus TaxID=8005 RepID=UPI0015D0085B|nr:AT-rich interactive domain-containing protein 5B [Electrophorus electricus]
MELNSLMWVGSPCGLHGPYIFYKAFRFNLEGKPRILSLGDFFFVRCKPEDPICIAELQLLWEERTTKQLLSSSKLYFLPEDTPQGRTVSHGEDEVIAVSEKVIVKLEDLVKWTVWDTSCWTKGLRAVPLKASMLKELSRTGQRETLHRYRESTLNSGLNFKDVLREKAELGDDREERRVLVLSYPQYCRYRSIVARLRERPAALLTDHVVLALGGIVSLTGSTQILYCRDTFEHPTLLENESVCDEFAPNLKGRPRKKKLSISQRRDSQGQGGCTKEPSGMEPKVPTKAKADTKMVVAKPKGSGGCKKATAEDKAKDEAGEECRAEEQAFLVALYKYMKERKTPIERIPYLGFKQINLWTMFQAAQKLGGYELITARRQWKNVYDELGGNPGSTSAATCTRRHYERLILPYERYTKGEEDKPLPPIKPRKQEAGSQEGGTKTKVPATKRPKDDQNPKGRNEKDGTAKVSEPGVEDVEDKEQPQEEGLAKQATQRPQLPVQREAEVRSPAAEDGGDVPLVIKEEEEKPALQKASWDGGPHEPVHRSKHASLPQDGTPLKSEDSEVFPVAASMPLRHSNPRPHAQDQWQHGTPEYKAPAHTLGNTEQAATNDSQNHVGMVLPTPKQRPPQPISVPEVPTERAELPTKEETFSYHPLLYPRGNPGIMSPLAKKKMLSQVSGTSMPSSFPYGPPPPLVNKKVSSRSTEETAAGQLGPEVPPTANEANVVIKRPSVIQHAQSFKPRGSEDKKPSVEPTQREVGGEGESYPSEHPQNQPLHQPQPSTTAESYMTRANSHSSMEKSVQIPRPGQAPSFLSDFYSSPHLHSLYRQTEHHLSKEQLSKYLNRETYPRDCETAHGFSQNQHPDSGSLTYCARLNQKEKGPPIERVTEEQPTDLSLPKPTPHKLPHSTSSLCGLQHSMMQQDVKSTPLFQAGNNQSSTLDYHPRACRVPPMTVSTPKKVVEPPSKAHNVRGEETMSFKIEEMARPILSSKSSPQNVGAARPLKRSLEELENGHTEKKIRAVTPMHCSTPRDVVVKVRTPEPDNESMKPAEPAHAVHINSYVAEGHKFPLHSPIFPGLYPGAFVSQVQDMCDSLSPHVPPGYSHPLQYLKNQSVLSPLMPPFAIHSIMMQRQLLAQAANPAHLYRHPMGTSYGDILHHGLYPMSALNPQAPFSPPQLSSVHPSTKLS